MKQAATKTSVSISSELCAQFSDEVSRLHRSHAVVRRALTSNSCIAEMALRYFFALPAEVKDTALAPIIAPLEPKHEEVA